MAQTITVDISAAGSIKIDAAGFKGKSCDKATEQLEMVLGGGMAKKKTKPEWGMPATNAQGTRLTF